MSNNKNVKSEIELQCIISIFIKEIINIVFRTIEC